MDTLTAKQAADFHGVSPWTVATWVKHGLLVPVAKAGQANLFQAEDVHTFDRPRMGRPVLTPSPEVKARRRSLRRSIARSLRELARLGAVIEREQARALGVEAQIAQDRAALKCIGAGA